MKIFIGYDTKQDLAYRVCKSSILKNSNLSIDVIPLKQNELKKSGIYTRNLDPLSSTEFTFTRFLVPYLTDYKDWALFIDCDFLFLSNINELFQLKNNKYAVMVVKHNYVPTTSTKMDMQRQLLYPRKNWSSLVLWNCNHPSNKNLTPDVVNNASGSYLHRFQWLSDDEIGEINLEWNWLVGWYKEPQDGKPKALHFTEGGPWFDNYKNCEYSTLWYSEHKKLNN